MPGKASKAKIGRQNASMSGKTPLVILTVIYKYVIIA
jgi:hypothetical protein